MNKTNIYWTLAAIAAGFVLADTLAAHRPFADAYVKGRSLAS